MFKNILITGGAGFIGSHLSNSLHNSNQLIVDNLSTGRLSNIFNQVIVIKNIQDDLENIFEEIAPDVVFHLAAIPGVHYSVEKPYESNDSNVTGTLNLLNLSVKYGVKRFVFSSSSAVYGDATVRKIDESHPLNPKSPYALQKKIGEDYCKMFSNLYGLETVCLRYFNVMGPRQYGNSPYSSVVSLFAQSIKDDSQPIIYGDGNQTRDFCPVQNIVHANILAATHNKPLYGEVFNIGCGNSVSVNELHELMKTKEAIRFPQRSGDIKNSTADISKAKEVLGYNIVKSFEEGLKETLDWYLKFS